MNKKIIFLSILLVLALFVVSACQQFKQKPVGKPIESNEEVGAEIPIIEEGDESKLNACITGCRFSYFACYIRCTNSICRERCNDIANECFRSCGIFYESE